MSAEIKNQFSRRDFIKVSAATTAGITMIPHIGCSTGTMPTPMKRKFGKHDFRVTTMGLGGQASLQWTPEGENPEAIILKAFDLGINYFDTSNLYQDSQLNYNKAFRKKNLIPGEPGYDEKLRESIWLTSKTAMRWGSRNWTERNGVTNWSNGKDVRCAADDVKRSLTQLFGDNNGNYPEGSYLDMVLIHTLHNEAEIDVLYEGLETPLDPNGNFGALVALRDLRDGTNLTGMNPKKEKLIRHIGFSGHNNPPAMIEMIQRDEWDILDGMLVAINANDKLMFNMQNNVIPVAEAKGMGIIGMKTFADAAMYHKEPTWSNNPGHVFRGVGQPGLPSRPLIEYSLTTPGVHTLIIGIGHIDDDPLKCQLVQNFYASQIEPDGLSPDERQGVEQMAAAVKDGRTNYFQMEKEELAGPRMLQKIERDGKDFISWQTAYAGDFPLDHYEIFIDGTLAGTVKHAPQILKSRPFVFEVAKPGKEVLVAAVDKQGSHYEARLT